MHVRMRGTIICIMRMRTANCWDGPSNAVGDLPLMLSSQASCMIVSGFRAALELDTYPLSNFIRPRCAERAKRGRGKPVLLMHIACFYAISLECSRFSIIATFFSCPCSTEDVGIAHKPLADTQNDYRNPRCACAPRVIILLFESRIR